MNTLVLAPEVNSESMLATTKQRVDQMIDDVINSLPRVEQLNAEQRREIIGRYTAVLEGNFIYWMTAAYLSVKSDAARPIIIDNLNEEVRDSHPVMLRKFAIAAHAFTTQADALAVHEELTRVRLFLGKLSGTQTILAMAYLEGFIQRFMGYLASLAIAQGSSELEYTDVHGVCDIAHTEGLFQALSIEMAVNPLISEMDLFEGVLLLDSLIRTVVYGKTAAVAA
jgi:hypothetical protein